MREVGLRVQRSFDGVFLRDELCLQHELRLPRELPLRTALRLRDGVCVCQGKVRLLSRS